MTKQGEKYRARKRAIEAFRAYLNALPGDGGHRHNRYNQRTRAYGDYLFAQDREKFEVDMQEWLKQNSV